MRWFALFAVAGGCGGDEGGSGIPGFPRACDESALDGDCILFSGDGWTSADVTGDCRGELLPACPPGADVGTCTIFVGQPDEVVTTFYVPFWTAADASRACDDEGGEWLP